MLAAQVPYLTELDGLVHLLGYVEKNCIARCSVAI